MTAFTPATAGATAQRRLQQQPRLSAIGTAVADHAFPQSSFVSIMQPLLGLDAPQQRRLERMVAGSGIDSRRTVMPPAAVVKLSTAERMGVFARLAPPLAADAARDAMGRAGIEPRRVTELFVVTCTGFAAPGVDVDLVADLGLRPDVRRTTIGFMGCFGAIVGLRAARAACAADPRSIALVVCVELCSLHVRAETSDENLVAATLFGDGAAAAIVRGDDDGAAPPIGGLTAGRTRLLPAGRDRMSWTITDAGFAMTLDRAVPEMLSAAIGPFVGGVTPAPQTLVVHPGGPAILDAVDEALQLDGRGGLETSREVLRRHGNMSSATVLFVLAESLTRNCRLPACLLAFGPGLTLECISVTRV